MACPVTDESSCSASQQSKAQEQEQPEIEKHTAATLWPLHQPLPKTQDHKNDKVSVLVNDFLL